MLGTITLTVGQPDGVTAVQSEDTPETMDSAVTKDETAPHANGEKTTDKEPVDAQDISIAEEKVVCEEKQQQQQQEEANEVGFKKIFRFVGFKFTLKKDKNEEKDPVKLLKVKEKDGDAVEDDVAEKVAEEPAEETTVTEEKVEETKTATPVGDDAEDAVKTADTEVPAEGAAADAVDETAKEEVVEKESSPPSQEATQSSFRKLLSGGLFSNLRKRASIKKTKEEEEKEKEKEAAAEEEIKEGNEAAEAVKEEGEEVAEVEPETKEEEPATTTEEAKPEPTAEAEGNDESPAAAKDNTEEEKPEAAEEEKPTTETELLSSQEKVKTHGSPLKKLFNGAGLKKLSTKKSKSKKEAEAKPTESTEQADELQTSTESEEAPKAESGPSSPEESGEHAVDGEASTIESSQETEGEVTSDGEKKREGILPWSSFKKLVTPKKRVKKSSESDEEAAAEKAGKSATLSSTESAVFEEKANEEEPKEEAAVEEEPKTETTEKLVSSTEEPKKKMDTSVSWEALMCMGGPKKRTRKTSDSDEEDETKLEEEPTPAAVAEEEQEAGVEEPPIVTSAETEPEEEVLPVDAANQTEKESAWDTLKRFVFAKNRPKLEEKAEDSPEQGNSDGEVQKEESSFSLRKLFPGRKKKKADQQASGEGGSGEEDSDTPAVVPLSEYDAEQTEDKQEEPSEPAVAPVQTSVEERAPSWIAAIVEDGDGKHDQLSDIPEEGDNAATPKSADTTIEEDDEEHPSMPPTTKAAPQRRLSLAEEKPFVPAVSSVTTPVPTGPATEVAEIVQEAAAEQISEALCQTSVTVEDLPVEEASVGTEVELEIEHAELKKNTILEPHNSEEALAICTGLGTKKIAKVALENPVTSTTECLTVITDSLCTEVALEEMPAEIEGAVATEDPIHEAQVQQVEATELEPSVEFLSDIPEAETATKGEEPEAEQTALIACLPEPSEVVKAAELDEGIPEVENLMAPTMETNVSMEIVEITHPAVEIKEEVMELDQFVAVEENTPVQEVTHVVTQQSITIETTSTNNITMEYSPCVDLKEVEIKADVEVSDGKVIEEVQINDTDTPVQAVLEVAMLETSNNLPEEDTQETEATVIEEQSIIIARAVIETAMDKVLEAKPPTPPPTEEDSSTPVQALLTTEEAIEEDTEKPVITETPVALVCEAPKVSMKQSPVVLCSAIQVTDIVPVEEAESLDGPAGSGQEPTAELQQAVEVNASESEVLVEEVVEFESESLPAEDPKEAKNDESKEEVEVEATPRPAVHMPVMVVLQSATVVEDTPLEEEAVEEFGTDGPPAVQDQDVKPECEEAVSAALPTLPEEPQTPAASTEEEAGAPEQEVPASAADTEEEAERAVAAERCAEVMAQVMEVIEEAVKEIEPISSEITAAS